MAKTKTKTTQKAKVWAYLNSGKGITSSIAETRFDVKNLRATISDLVITEKVKITSQVDKRSGETKYSKAK